MRRYVVAFGALGHLVVELLPPTWRKALKSTGPIWPLDGPTNPMSHGKR